MEMAGLERSVARGERGGLLCLPHHAEKSRRVLRRMADGANVNAMIGFGDQLSDEEIWSIIQYERGFAGDHGHGMMGHGEGMGSGMGPGGMGGMGHRGPRGMMGECEGEACGR